MLQISIFDKHPMMADALARLIRRVNPEVDICRETQIRALTSTSPDIVVIDPIQYSGFDLRDLREIIGSDPQRQVVFFSAASSDTLGEHAKALPGDFVISKSSTVKEIVSVLGAALPAFKHPIGHPTKLSRRALQLLVSLDSGLSAPEIAEGMGISPHTVKVHSSRLYDRLNVNSRMQALAFARRNGFL